MPEPVELKLPVRMIHQATRYVLGRMSYAVADHCDWLIANWARIPESERRVITRDVEEAFEQHARLAEEANKIGGKPMRWSPLGMPMDQRSWSKVRDLWYVSPPPKTDHHGNEEDSE